MKESSGAGLGTGSVLFLIFLVLKLCKVIDWSWWWVTSPLWIGAGIYVLIGLVLLIVYLAVNKRRIK